MSLNPDLIATLKQLSVFLEETRDHWWVLGSAGIALQGFNLIDIGDVDVLLSQKDSERLMQLHLLPNHADGGTQRYKSEVFLKPDLGPLPVEIMSNYQIKADGIWKHINPKTRISVDIEGTRLFTPDLQEQIHILEILNRPKDLRRLTQINSKKNDAYNQ